MMKAFKQAPLFNTASFRAFKINGFTKEFSENDLMRALSWGGRDLKVYRDKKNSTAYAVMKNCEIASFCWSKVKGRLNVKNKSLSVNFVDVKSLPATLELSSFIPRPWNASIRYSPFIVVDNFDINLSKDEIVSFLKNYGEIRRLEMTKDSYGNFNGKIRALCGSKEDALKIVASLNAKTFRDRTLLAEITTCPVENPFSLHSKNHVQIDESSTCAFQVIGLPYYYSPNLIKRLFGESHGLVHVELKEPGSAIIYHTKRQVLDSIVKKFNFTRIDGHLIQLFDVTKLTRPHDDRSVF